LTRNQIMAALRFALVLPVSNAAFVVRSRDILAQQASYVTRGSGGQLTVNTGPDKSLVRIRALVKVVFEREKG